MLDSKLIMHASQSEAQCFVDGMYLFFVKSAEKTEGRYLKSLCMIGPISYCLFHVVRFYNHFFFNLLNSLVLHFCNLALF